ncbi:MAG: family acetyltransferase [Mucilaginibacter sp.]|uniref:GNAT family N-acetyltransferase n=1 Tax=Mucilaginibacter sp. TaxID=1882438 RepID=UPI0026230629|nr:GNAT family N-acetyltransferase [Mucilaginibacter sp.]MDB5004751.1 family acetyltransferase [Mucilaginibacter sp.]
MSITPATLTDVPELVGLINSAYRGETSKKGWTTEANLIDGQRIDVDSLTAQISDPEAIILKNTNNEGIITGCVYLQKRANKLYLGMLTVSPTLQTNGLGKQLLQAVETYARNINIKSIIMTVITTRTELISWYERRGYSKTGEVIPLLIPSQFGTVKQPLEMFWLEKVL